MTLEEFRSVATEPSDLGAPLRAMWLDAAGQWDAAHRAVQDDGSPDAAWVHAYLHRKEGDASNAEYWYTRAGKQMFPGDLAAEWDEIAGELLSR